MNNVVPIEAAPSVRTLARQQGIDLPCLLDILSLRRPEGSATEEQFVKVFLDTIIGMQKDDYGNRYLRIGTAPVMWSSHTDTVSNGHGQQNLRWRGNILELNQPKLGQTLGADDGAGIWLMIEMIKAGREGLYIFHREEEVGGLGSKDIAKNFPDLVKDIQMAIAFDRKATHSIITFQRGSRCCSDAFGDSLADALNLTEGLEFKLDTGGVFTDTASYTKLIPECTNLSAGYYDEHTSKETLDVAHLMRLREALLTLDVSKLVIERDPSKVESRGYAGYGGYGGYNPNNFSAKDDALDDLFDYVQKYPFSIAKWFHKAGISATILDKLVLPPLPKALPLPAPKYEEWKGALADIHDEDPEEVAFDDEVGEETGLYCRDCDGTSTEWELRRDARDGEVCAHCNSNNTVAMEILVDLLTGEVVEHA